MQTHTNVVQLTIVTFYKFVDLPQYADLQIKIKDLCQAQDIRGTILLAKEGINATISGRSIAITTILDYLKSYPEFADLEYKISYHANHPFKRLKVRLKKEIVTLGIANLAPHKATGIYIDPADWNGLISDPDTITIDTRNKYEVKIGSFKHAINPQTDTFSQFPAYFTKNFDKLDRNQKIAMYCTGGIRCEKSTAYLLSLGFKNVYHLAGGILNYLAKVPKMSSLWQGECFLFDQRVGVDHQLIKGNYSMCYGCRHPVSATERTTTEYKEGIFCPNCINSIPTKTIQRATMRHQQSLLAKNSI